MLMSIFGGLFGKSDVESMRKEKNVKALIKALINKDADVRRQAAAALGNIRDQTAVDPLIVALGDQTSAVRQSATEALGRIGGEKASDALLLLLGESGKAGNRDEVLSLFKILGDNNFKNAIMPILRCARLNAWFWLEAAQQLDKLGWKPELASERFEYLLWKQDYGNLSKAGASAVQQILGAMAELSGPASQKYTFALDRIRDLTQVLGKIGAPAIEPLVRTMADERSQIRETDLVDAFAQVGAPAVGCLINELRNKKNERIRNTVRGALCKIAWSPRDVEEHAALLATRDWDTLAKVGSDALEPLLLLLADEGWASDLQEFWHDQKLRVVMALLKIGDSRARRPVLKWLFMDPQSCRVWEGLTVDKNHSWGMMDKLFGDYGALAMKASTFSSKISGEMGTYSDNIFYSYDTNICENATRELCAINSDASTIILTYVEKKEDIKVAQSYHSRGHGTGKCDYETLSFEDQRKIARNELARRGKPSIDELVLSNVEAWKCKQ